MIGSNMLCTCTSPRLSVCLSLLLCMLSLPLPLPLQLAASSPSCPPSLGERPFKIRSSQLPFPPIHPAHSLTSYSLTAQLRHCSATLSLGLHAARHSPLSPPPSPSYARSGQPSIASSLTVPALRA
eukprot:scaffold167536_cov28-Tisochrysis_lutea.AAC.1